MNIGEAVELAGRVDLPGAEVVKASTLSILILAYSERLICPLCVTQYK